MSGSGGVTLTDQVSGGVRTRVVASSGVVANAQAVATLPAAAGKLTWLTAFQVTALGATAAAAVDVTVAGPSATLHYALVFPAGVGVLATPLVIELANPVPAAAVNTAIVCTVPAAGAGNTYCAVNAFGFQA